MEIRGERKCSSCGERWSYYETGSVSCPACGSVRSVGVDERTEHTASPVSFDLTPVRNAIDEDPLHELADRAADRTREYTARVGFVHAGELQLLEETYLAAAELRRVGTTLGHAMRVTDEEELYFLDLLRGADHGERPAPETVPETFRPERGLAVTSSVDAYLTDLRRVLDEREGPVDTVLSSVTTHRKRIEALDGDVDPQDAERLVATVRDLSVYLREDDEMALARAQDRLDDVA